MRDIERAVENVLSERIAETEPSTKVGQQLGTLVQRLEDFTFNNLKFLAIGAAGGILGLSAMTLFQPEVMRSDSADPIIVGSIDANSSVSARTKWVPLQKPIQILALESPQLAGLVPRYAARKSDKGALQDEISFEPGPSKRPDLRVILTRGLTANTVSSLYIDMTRQQADRGFSVTKASQSGTLHSKFGPLEVSDMTFSSNEEKSRACLAFRSTPGSGSIGLSGWYCAAETSVTERPELTCILDKLVLLKSGQDKELRRYFTEAEKARTPCATARASTGRKPTWLDADGKAPEFRSDITGSLDAQPLPRKVKSIR